MKRAGFSLLEVILAVGILTGAIAVLGELGRSSLESARTARDMTQAELLCESKLAELVAGVLPLEPVTLASFDDSLLLVDPVWLYSIETMLLDETGLTELRVTVTQDLPAAQRPVSVTLVRWIIDPSYATAEETPQPAETSGG